VKNGTFGTLDPRKNGMLALLNPDGTLTEQAEDFPPMEDETALEAYRTMVLTREVDSWAISLNRQGRMGTYVPNIGQEANAVGALLAVQKDDWFVPAFRDLGGFLVRGVPLEKYYLYWAGNEIGSHLPREELHMMPVSVPVGSQTLHAVGIAKAEQYRGSSKVVLAFMGDGATSQGEVAEAFNFAGVWRSPIVFYVQNNQWAISVPVSMQTASRTFAEKAFGFGFEGVLIDGNDVFAVHAAVSLAAQKARRGGGPTLIEGFTYRIGAHTTSDDPSLYRDEEGVKEWAARDPILRLERYLTGRGLLTDDQIESIRQDAAERARDAARKADSYNSPDDEDTFLYTYRTMPPVLRRQLAARQARHEPGDTKPVKKEVATLKR
jgi:pyruvate dehydrogenase E1 component alpha subunit